MRIFLSRIFLIVLGASSIQSCKHSSDHPDKVKTLDSLLQVLSSAEQKLNSLDTNLILSKAHSLSKTVRSLKEIKPDTIDKETGLIFEKLINQKKPFDVYRKKRVLFSKQISFTKEQLVNLSHDLDKNLVPEEKVEEYFAIEQRKTTELIDLALLTVKAMNESLVNYDSINAPIREMILKLKAANDSVASSKK